jgi:hypothetical protein
MKMREENRTKGVYVASGSLLRDQFQSTRLTENLTLGIALHGVKPGFVCTIILKRGRCWGKIKPCE